HLGIPFGGLLEGSGILSRKPEGAHPIDNLPRSPHDPRLHFGVSLSGCRRQSVNGYLRSPALRMPRNAARPSGDVNCACFRPFANQTRPRGPQPPSRTTPAKRNTISEPYFGLVFGRTCFATFALSASEVGLRNFSSASPTHLETSFLLSLRAVAACLSISP